MNTPCAVGNITFDPVLHEYRVDGEIKKSVTQIIRAALGTPPWYNAEAAEQGRKIHELTVELDGVIDLGLTPGTTPIELVGYLDAWRAFRAETECVIRGTECMGYLPGLDCCGTTDRLVSLWKKAMPIDIKTGAPSEGDPAQVSAYARMFGLLRGGLVYLKASGRYTFEPVDVERGFSKFYAMWMETINV